MFSITKRKILAGAATAAIGAVVPPAAAAAVDPIFDAIERHRAAALKSDQLAEIVDDVFYGRLSEFDEVTDYEAWAAVRRVEERQRLQDPQIAAVVAASAAADAEHDLSLIHISEPTRPY